MREEVVEYLRICVYVGIGVCVCVRVRSCVRACIPLERSARTRSHTKCWATSRTIKWWKDS